MQPVHGKGKQMQKKVKSLLCFALAAVLVFLMICIGLSSYHILHVHKNLSADCPICNIIADLSTIKLIILVAFATIYTKTSAEQNANFFENMHEFTHITPVTLRVKLLD